MPIILQIYAKGLLIRTDFRNIAGRKTLVSNNMFAVIVQLQNILSRMSDILPNQSLRVLRCVTLSAVLFNLWLSVELEASSFKPIITNFPPKAYSNNGGVQNWDIAQGRNGEIYIGNNKGLLIFDGYTWRIAAIPGNMVVRSLFVDGDRIYIGSYEEFGYFTVSAIGQYVYHSLSKSVSKSFPMRNEEVWSITKYNNKVYFQTFNSLFVYDGRTATPLHDDNVVPLYLHKIHNRLYVQNIKGGYYRFDGKRCSLLYGKEVFGNDNIVAAVSLRNGAILCSEDKGLFLMDKSFRLQKLNTEADKDFSSFKINRAIITKDSTVVIGTLLNGIYAIDLRGRLLWHYNTENGLQNNSVLRLMCDRDNNIWAALDNGVALIYNGSRCTMLTPDRSDPQIGMVFDLLLDGRSIWMATNQGFYRYNTDTGHFAFINGTGGQNWHISRFGGQLFLGNNSCTMTVTNGVAEPVPFTDNSTCMRLCTLNSQEVILEASYSPLHIYRRNAAGIWSLDHEVKGFSSPVRQMEVDSKGVIWAANMNKGVFRIELTQDLRSVAKQEYFSSLDGSSPTMNYVMKIMGQVVFSDNKRLYTYDDRSHQFVPNEKLNRIQIASTCIHSSTTVDSNTFWLSGSNGYILMRYVGGQPQVQRFEAAEFFGLQNNENQDKVVINGNTAYFNMSNGVVRCQIGGDSDNWTKPALVVASVTSTVSDNERIVHLPISTSNDAPAKTQGNIKICFSFPNFIHKKILFRYVLKKGKAVSDTLSCQPAVEYKNLRYGEYTVEASAMDVNGETIARCAYRFIVPVPFYLTVWAFLLYAAALAAAVYLLSKWRTDREVQKRRKEFEAEKAKQDIKMLEQEKLIAQQRQQLLEAELSSQGKLLANLSLNVYTKEKVIEGLKESIKAHKLKSAGNVSDMDALLRQIESVSGNIEFLNIYQKNFDLIHEHFFRNLRERYPALTSNDLKLCALLRLNMSTKDIANFTNMGIRGVETARYRLRRKLGLPAEQALIDFLIDFK